MKISWLHVGYAGWLCCVSMAGVACGSNNVPADGPAAAGGAANSADADTSVDGQAGSPSSNGPSTGVTGGCASGAAPTQTSSPGTDPNAPALTPIYVKDLFTEFSSLCGDCHVSTTSGGLHVTSSNFAAVVGQNAVDRILSNSSFTIMPPATAGGKLASERQPDDPVLQFVGRLKLWIAAGKPPDLFCVADNASAAEVSPRGGEPTP